MKNLMNRIAMMAASVAVLGTMAFAQERVNATIPFAFRTVNGSLPAGDYAVTRQNRSSGGTIMKLTDGKHSVVALGTTFDRYAAGDPALTFRCKGSNCVLESVRMLDGAITYALPKNAKGVETAVVTIPLRVVNGD